MKTMHVPIYAWKVLGKKLYLAINFDPFLDLRHI